MSCYDSMHAFFLRESLLLLWIHTRSILYAHFIKYSAGAWVNLSDKSLLITECWVSVCFGKITSTSLRGVFEYSPSLGDFPITRLWNINHISILVILVKIRLIYIKVWVPPRKVLGSQVFLDRERTNTLILTIPVLMVPKLHPLKLPDGWEHNVVYSQVQGVLCQPKMGYFKHIRCLASIRYVWWPVLSIWLKQCQTGKADILVLARPCFLFYWPCISLLLLVVDLNRHYRKVVLFSVQMLSKPVE